MIEEIAEKTLVYEVLNSFFILSGQSVRKQDRLIAVIFSVPHETIGVNLVRRPIVYFLNNLSIV
ncbi:MAG: hypothetical protein J7497_16760 [Chitinophagaceae bacterium]|nr:hypothetical protein [Chitinophagaceae bacterium]